MPEAQAWVPLFDMATSLAALAGILITNARISDLHHRITDLQEQYRRLETVLVGKLAEIESRLDQD